MLDKAPGRAGVSSWLRDGGDGNGDNAAADGRMLTAAMPAAGLLIPRMLERPLFRTEPPNLRSL